MSVKIVLFSLEIQRKTFIRSLVFELQPTTIACHVVQYDEACSEGSVGSFAYYRCAISFLEDRQAEVNLVLYTIVSNIAIFAVDEESPV